MSGDASGAGKVAERIPDMGDIVESLHDLFGVSLDERGRPSETGEPAACDRKDGGVGYILKGAPLALNKLEKKPMTITLLKVLD